MEPDELERRVNANLKPLDVKSASEVADSVFKASETKPVLETVETKPDPELAPTIGFWETIQAWFSGYAKQEVTNQFEGKPVDSPFAPVSFLTLNWKWLAIGTVVIGVLYLLLRWIF